ncbi:transporter substrate-binding domain-containing protein [Colwellia sp. 1_MG-2023]|uniref:substrate-binding periplasmic protein n=1 Tax=Colwellia sp. 1_MG-2023 TaxID=3062649 RepID=UPI0026E3FB3E|nr:transporter substrate-binding domain-containing protein [Colwellia sp. 1_MG-2023]MDO6447076.1 transporter substrate-binding domain-containing protein [Colwellia sp. 1_MG-2023]
MGYRTSERLPFIAEAPSHEGLYYALYSKALANIGCQLKVIRAPKKRVLHMLKSGEIDFYPGLGYSDEREEYLHFIDSGLKSRSAIISHVDTKPVKSLAEMKGKTLLIAHGAKPIDGEKYGVFMRSGYDLSLAQVVDLISKKQVDFYFYNEDNINYFLAQNPNENIKVYSINENPTVLHLGFSRKSQFALEEYNTAFDPLSDKSLVNREYVLTTNNKAYQFQQSLIELKNQGVTNKLVREFFYQQHIH